MKNLFKIRALSPVATAAAAVVMLCSGLALMLWGAQQTRQGKIDEVRVQASILAATVTAALDFRDHDAAQEYVDALAVNPEIREVGLYDAKGVLFAGYKRDDARQLPPTIELNRTEDAEADRLVLTEPVQENGITLGGVYMRTTLESWTRRLRRYSLMTLLATMAALVIAVLGNAQSTLTRANKLLKRQTLDLANANDELQTQIFERERAEAALRQAQKMEAIGQLTGGIAHDFNNLLQVILGNLDLLVRQPAVLSSERSQRLVAAATAGAERGAGLTARLLAFGRRQPLAAKSFDVNNLVKQMLDLLHRTLGEGVKIETKLAPKLWRASADPHQLESALLNLAVNARDAMPNGGTLTIDTSCSHVDKNDAGDNDFKDGDYVRITVSDTGEGMTPETLTRAVEPFFTTKGVGQGSGLGLSQVYGFVKQSGGTVKIQSERGAGTTIALYLPRTTEIGVIAEPMNFLAPEPVAKIEQDGQTVLVVEDEEIVLSTAVEGLTRLGYRVLSADHAAAALDILKGDRTIDILFSDVVMPGTMNGVELATEATRLRPAIKVLLTSGYPRNALSVQHGLRDDIPILTKPYRAHELATRLQNMTRVA